MRGYRIRTVAEMTGLSRALLRAWEARYGLVSPERTESGYRIYSDTDVALFRGAQRLVQRGLAPMQVARLPRSQLLEAGGTPPSHPSPRVEPTAVFSYTELLEQALVAISHFDSERTQELVALALLLMKPETACRNFLVPLMTAIGERWQCGEMSVAAEHFGTAIVREKLIVLLDTLRTRRATHQVLCACPAGERHEIGLLAFAVEAAAQGFAPIYLGSDVPLADLGAAVQRSRPDLVAISFALERKPKELRELLLALRSSVPSSLPLLVGGRGIEERDALIRETGCTTLPGSGRIIDLMPQQRTARAGTARAQTRSK